MEIKERKGMDRSNTTTYSAPRISSLSEPIKYLQKQWTRSFPSPSSALPLLYLILPLNSLSEFAVGAALPPIVTIMVTTQHLPTLSNYEV